ncbi:MAG TPA: hypothetical protein VGL52_00570 [Casimicrobiaceae bacterium]
MVLRFERLHGYTDAEEIGEEVLEMRRDLDQELRFVLGAERGGFGARGGEPRRQRSVGLSEARNEVPVDTGGAFDRVEVAEGESVGKAKHLIE